MQMMSSQSVQVIPRPNEHERLVADLIDQRFFGPVAITTSLNGARGMGKTALAREVCRDPRVVESFPDGILWVTLGQNLSPLQLLSRIERLSYDISGEQRGLIDLKTAEAHLRELVHPRRMLLVLDEANDIESIRPFLQTGPGGGVMIITRRDEILPLGSRRTPVDIMFTEEAVALLALGLIELLPKETAQEIPPAAEPDVTGGHDLPEPGEAVIREETEAPEYPHIDESTLNDDPLLAGLEPAERSPQLAAGSRLIDPVTRAALRQAEIVFKAVNAGLPAEGVNLLADLAGQLNEWPFLLSLANGYLRASLLTPGMLPSRSVSEAARLVTERLTANGLAEVWQVNDAAQRDLALSVVITTCIEALPEDVRQRFLDLAIFPLDEEIPLAAVSVLWRTSSQDTFKHAEVLNRHGLIGLDTSAWTLRMHPILRGYIIDRLRAGAQKELHRVMVEGYASRCKVHPKQAGVVGWASGPDDGYFFQHLGLHLVSSGQRLELQRLLFDFRWLHAYLTCTNLLTGRRGDLFSLLLDYEMALSIALDRQSAQLRLVEDALRLSAPLLIRDPSQLSSQLLGRLLSFNEPDIQALLRQAEDWTDEPWLRPLTACFTLPGGNEVRTLTGHEDWVTGLALLPDGQHAVSGSLDGSLRWWDLANGQNLRSLWAHKAGVSAITVSPDGRKVITAGWEGRVRVWDTFSGDVLIEFDAHPEAVGALAVTPDGLRVITGADDRLIRVWEIDSGKMIAELLGHGDPVRALAVTPDGKMLLSGSWDCTVRAWNLETNLQEQFMDGHTGWVSALAVTPDGRSVLSTGWDKTIRVWDLDSSEEIRSITGFRHPLLSLVITPAGDRLVAGCGNGDLMVIDFASGDIIRTLTGHSGGINQIAVTNEGRFAISAADDRTVRIWDLVAIEAERGQPGHDAPVFAMEALPDGSRSISASWDGTLKIWDLATGSETNQLTGHLAGIVALAVSDDGRMAVSGSRDHTLKVWDLEKGEELRTLPGHAGAITAVSLTPDGAFAVSGADDGTLKVWELASGICLADFRGENSIWSCALAQDGKTVVASESGGKMYFLEMKLGRA